MPMPLEQRGPLWRKRLSDWCGAAIGHMSPRSTNPMMPRRSPRAVQFQRIGRPTPSRRGPKPGAVETYTAFGVGVDSPSGLSSPWCDQIPTLPGNQLCPYSEHSWAQRQSHDSGKLLGHWGVKSPKIGVCYESHSPRLSKTVRAAVGRSIFPACGPHRFAKAETGKGGPADRRA